MPRPRRPESGDIGAGRVDRHPEPCDDPGGAGRAADGRDREGGPDLKRLAGGGRKLAKPVLHYSLSWARDETPDRRETSRAVDGSLEALGAGGPRGADRRARRHPARPRPRSSPTGSIRRPERRRSWATASSGCRAGPRATSGNRAGSGARSGSRTTRGGGRGEEVLRPIWDRPLHLARHRREG